MIGEIRIHGIMKVVSSNYRQIILRDHFLVWTGAFLMFVLVRSVGTREVNGFDLPLSTSLMIVLVFGVIFGLISGIATLYFLERFYRRISLRKFLFARIAFTVSFVFAILIGAYLIYKYVLEILDIPLALYLAQPIIWVMFLYMMTVDFGLALFGQVNLMLGRGNMKKMIRGQFYEPKEEVRIFMFLDLQSATTIAEKIGHLQFSRLIQDCFNDLAIVENFGAQVYQYVGDEAVLSWTSKGVEGGKCVKAYFAFKELLERKEDYYQSTYGYLPFFKAGIHMGKVTASEVGKYKREIAYHGDTINTAARIQAMCNELNAGLLISDQLKHVLNGYDGLVFDSKGAQTLKGKEHSVELWSVNQA